MADQLKLFSPEWCAAAREAANTNDAVHQGFKDPSTFTHKMAFTCADRDLGTHMEWEQAKVVHWGTPGVRRRRSVADHHRRRLDVAGGG